MLNKDYLICGHFVGNESMWIDILLAMMNTNIEHVFENDLNLVNFSILILNITKN